MLSLRALLCLAALVGTTVAATAESCRESVGAARSAVLVDRCLQVSTATRPPCNADNACALIESEIRRGCSGLGGDAPGFCER